ncbi:MAG: hypothetical protein M1480_11475 [Bacteroidetes bacterium]|nr:hypothetical protein [Bacteroidota bacterium]
MKTLKFIFIIISILIISSLNLQAQAIQNAESRYSRLQYDLKFEQSKLDSLKNIFNGRVKKIDEEKSKKNSNKDVITNLMSGSISITHEIDLEQKKVDGIEKNLENVKRELSKIYSEKIDSLQEAETKTNISVEESNKLKAEVFSFIEKKMMVAPKTSLLSFNPEKIAAIDLKKINDPQEKDIYKDYLQNALAEVDDRLSNVNGTISELNQIITLQKKTKRFLEETEFETNIQQQSASATTSTQAVPDYYNGKTSDAKAELSSQVQDYNLLLGQLRQPSDGKVKWENNYDPKNPNLTLKQYQNLLKELKKKLLEYKLIINNKLGPAK